MSMVIPHAVTNSGWTFYERCVCNLVKKVKFRHAQHPGLQLEWWVSYGQFKIMNGNTTKVPLTPLSKLTETMPTL